MKKRYKLLIILCLIIGLVLYILPRHVLPYALLQPQRVQAVNTLESKRIPYSNVEILTKDSLKLKGYFVKSSLDTTYASIILVHGIGGCKQHFTDLAIDLPLEATIVGFSIIELMVKVKACLLPMVTKKKTISLI